MMRELSLKGNILSLFILLSCYYLPAQQKVYTDLSLKYEIICETAFFTTDRLQQLYIVEANNDLVKYDENGNELFRFSNNKLGALVSVDVTNPFNILLFYPEYLTLLTLDRTLSLTGTYNLFDLDIFDVQAVGLSNDNNIWLFDPTTFKLKKINGKGNELTESDDLSLLLGTSLHPTTILERENRLYLNDANIGILVFDIYGEYINTINIKGIQHLQIGEGKMIYQKDNTVYVMHLSSSIGVPLNLPPSVQTVGQVRLYHNLLFAGNGEGVSVYNLNNH